MLKTEKWMPVFLLTAEAKINVAAHPTEITKSDYIIPTQNTLRRIGTAKEKEDGSWIIDLVSAIPGGQIVMRPPKDGESYDYQIQV